MGRASSAVGAATLAVRDRELRMLEYAIAASIALHLLAFATLQLAAPRPEPAAPVPGPISARLLEPPAQSAPTTPAAPAAASAADQVADQKPAPEPIARLEGATQSAPPQAPEREVAPKTAGASDIAARPESKVEAKPKPTPRPAPRPEPMRAAKPKPNPKPKREAARPVPESEAAVASVAPPDLVAPGASAAALPGTRAAPLPAPASGAPAIDEDLLGRYRLQLISAARRYKRYPRAALDNQWEGAAEVAMVIGDNGRIREVSISKSSGHEVLDRQAIDMFRKAKPLVPIPAGLRGREFRVTLKAIYSLRDPGA